jgi:hypothetical protein
MNFAFMRNLVILIFTLNCTSCFVNYPLTTFYVKNTTDKTLNFKASVMKRSSMGPFEMTLPFAVLPHDSVIARRTNFKTDASPAAWFTRFIIFPTDSVLFNDPDNQDNWIKTTDERGRPIYTFTMSK